jgi:hypothetical protein
MVARGRGGEGGGAEAEAEAALTKPNCYPNPNFNDGIVMKKKCLAPFY